MNQLPPSGGTVHPIRHSDGLAGLVVRLGQPRGSRRLGSNSGRSTGLGGAMEFGWPVAAR